MSDGNVTSNCYMCGTEIVQGPGDDHDTCDPCYAEEHKQMLEQIRREDW